MLEFLQKFFLNGFLSGDYDYGFIHITAILVALSMSILLPIYFKKKSDEHVWRFLQIFAGIVLFIFISRRVIGFVSNGDFLPKQFVNYFWLFYLCNINTVVICLMLLFKSKKGYEYIMITGFIGGLLTFTVPAGVFGDKYLTYGTLDSITSHLILVVVPPIFIVKNYWKPNFSRMNQVVLGMLIVVFNAEVVQRIFFGKSYTDYLFFHDTLPFTIPGRPDLQYLVVIFSFLALLYFIYFINYLLNNRNLIKGKITQLIKSPQI